MSSQSYIYNPTERTLAAAGDGFAPPRLTTAGRLALTLGPGDKGMTVYDTTLGFPFWWTGIAWATFSGGTAYAQGTWLARLICPIGTITEDPAVKTGYWSQIGNTVSISMRFRVQAIAGPSGLLQMITLPYPAVQESAAVIVVNGLTNLARTEICGYFSGSAINMYHYDSGTLQDLGQHVVAGSDWYISGTYITP